MSIQNLLFDRAMHFLLVSQVQMRLEDSYYFAAAEHHTNDQIT